MLPTVALPPWDAMLEGQELMVILQNPSFYREENRYREGVGMKLLFLRIWPVPAAGRPAAQRGKLCLHDLARSAPSPGQVGCKGGLGRIRPGAKLPPSFPPSLAFPFFFFTSKQPFYYPADSEKCLTSKVNSPEKGSLRHLIFLLPSLFFATSWKYQVRFIIIWLDLHEIVS